MKKLSLFILVLSAVLFACNNKTNNDKKQTGLIKKFADLPSYADYAPNEVAEDTVAANKKEVAQTQTEVKTNTDVKTDVKTTEVKTEVKKDTKVVTTEPKKETTTVKDTKTANTTTKTTNTVKTATAKYYVVGGTFKSMENAKKRIELFKKDGYKDCEILPKEKDMYRVSVTKFNEKTDASKEIKFLKEKHKEIDFWVYTKK